MKTLRLGHALADHKGIVRCVDPLFCELVGVEPTDVIGRHVLDITHPDDRSQNRAAIELLFQQDRPFRIDKRYIRADGSSIAVRNHVSLFRGTDGPPSMIAATQLMPANDDQERRERFVYSALDALADASGR